MMMICSLLLWLGRAQLPRLDAARAALYIDIALVDVELEFSLNGHVCVGLEEVLMDGGGNEETDP